MDIRVYDRILRDLIVFNDALTEENYESFGALKDLKLYLEKEIWEET